MPDTNTVLRDVEARAPEIANRAVSDYGISPALAVLYAIAYVVTEAFDRTPPEIISGWRSSAIQDAMRARWDAGDRAGLAVRPAATSKHPERRAIDVGHRDEVFAYVMRALGARDGAQFSTPDPTHFDL
jgi:hypothetical protein